MARVPLQTAPGAQVETSGEVQYGAVGVEPMKDVVSDDIKRFGKAYQQFGKAINKLDDELNDAEGKKLSNDYYAEVEATKNEYISLKGVNAVGTVEVDGENITVFEQYQRKLKGIYESYEEKASNGTVKYIFGNKASVYTKAGLNDMTAHSLKEQRSYLTSETTQEITNSQTAAKTHFESWNDPGGLFRQNYAIGIAKIQEKAVLKGWNIDPNAIDPTDPKGERTLGVSAQYLAEIEKYNMDIMKAVVKSLKDKGDFDGAKKFLRALDPNGESEDVEEVAKIVTTEQIEHGNSKCVDSIISNNGNQNDGNFLNQTDALLCLSSNQASDDGRGGSVVDGNNSNEIDITDRTQSENIDTLDKLKSTSKFYQPDSSTRLIPQHQTTHLFAIQKLGVKQADSLYTKAKSSVEVDEERFKTDPEYATEINKQIITNYNKLILEASEKKYRPEIVKIENQIEALRKKQGGGRSFQNNKVKKINELLVELEKAKENDPKYVEKIENDLNIITNGIDYNFGSEESTIEIDEVTGLQPLEVLKAKLKATITNPKELATAIKDLEIKYNKIKAEREANYKGALEQAQEIAFAEPGGWKQLVANGIDINDFTEADQKILKNGSPDEPNVDTEVELINNPAEVRDNLNAYRPKLSSTQYLKLKQYSESLNNENNYVEATGNSTMLKATLSRLGMGDLWTSKNKKKKQQFIAINDAWLKEINARQITKGNVKLTLGEKQAALVHVLMDEVNVDNDPGIFNWWGGDKKNVNIHLVDRDRLEDVYVDIPYKGKNERVFISKIDPEVLILIKDSLRSAGKTVSQENIADYYLQKGRPKDTAAAYAYKEEQ